MNTRRIFATALAAGTLAAGMIFATGQLTQVRAQSDAAPQPGGKMHGGQMHGGRMQKMAEELGLTADQKAKIKPIMDAQRTKMMAIRQNTTLTPEAQRAQMKQVWENTHAQIKPLLTPDQIKKMEAMHASMRQHRPGGPAGQ